MEFSTRSCELRPDRSGFTEWSEWETHESTPEADARVAAYTAEIAERADEFRRDLLSIIEPG